MNSYIKTLIILFKIIAAVCFDAKTIIDIYKDEVNKYWNPVKQEINLNYPTNELEQICSNILHNNDKNKKYEIIFEHKETKINIK